MATNSRIPGVIRQGDVLLVPVPSVPATAKARQRTNGRVILAYGEVTGHHHSFAARKGVALLDEGATTYLTIDELIGAQPLEHQEHEAIPVPPGNYRVVIQHEWSDELEPRRVAD